MAIPKWDDERVQALVAAVGNESPVTQDTVKRVAQELETSARSVSSKLRKMDFEVELASAAAKSKSFSDEQEASLQALVEANSGNLTYAELADAFEGDFSAKQIQGKILSMELTDHVKATPKKESTKTYTDAEEATFSEMAGAGAFLEDIAEALGKPLASVRGKGLSLMRSGAIESIPKQQNVKGKETADPFADLGDLAEFTVATLAEKLEKTERGVKTMLTRRGLTVSDYDGAARKAKTEEKAA